MYVCKNDYKNMIKIGVFGITDETIALTRRIKRENEFVLTGLSFSPTTSGPPVAEASGFLSTDPEEILLTSDLLIFSDPCPGDLLFIRAAIRMSRPLFFPVTTRLSPETLEEINALAREGEVPVHCYNPLRDHPLFQAALQQAGRPLFTEIIRRDRADNGWESILNESLIHSLEATLSMNVTRPQRPVAGAYFRPGTSTGMVHIQMGFNDGMTALIRHELTEDGHALLCRIAGESDTVTADLANQMLSPRSLFPPTRYVRTKIRKGDPSSLLYHSFHNFTRQRGSVHHPVPDERIHATRLTEYIMEKIHSKTLTHLPAENNR